MAMKKRGVPKRWRTKEGKELARAAEAAGGTVTVTGKGHIKIVEPEGVAFVASDPGSNRLAATYETVRAKTGLDI